MRTDKIFRDYVNRLNKQDTEIRKLKTAINKITNRSVSIVATGSSGEDPTNTHSTLEGVQGNGPIHLSDDETDHFDFFNGTFNEKVTAAITEAAGVVTLTVGQTGGGDLTSRFVDGYGVLADNSTIALTVGGSDAAPQLNFIYVLQSDPTALVKDTTDWPHTVDHIKIARILCPTAAFVAANGVYSFQLWNDENDDDLFQGHMSHGSDRIRVMGAHWDSGVAGNGTDGYLTPTNNNTELISTAGVVYQLHRHVVPVFTTVDNDVVLVKNWSGTAYHDITNLYDIVADSGGNAIGATKWFKIVIWGVANLTGSGFEPMIINLPSGFYNTQAACELDADGHADVVIPTEFRGTGYLIASVVIQRAATWVIGSTKDLRGQTPSTVGGGGSRYTDAEVEAYVNSVANAGIATGDSLVFVDVTDGALKQDLVSDLNVLAVAAVKAEDPLALAGDLTTATGKSITSGDDIIANDGDFPIMSYRAGNADRPSVEFDTNDALFYNQTNNDFQFVIGSTVEFFVTPTLIYVPSNKVGIKMVPTTDLELANDSAQKPTTNTWTITSDEAIKQDIQDYTLGLAALMNIRPRQFKYKPVYDIDKTHDMDKTHVGLVAQEIELVVPSTVSMGKRNYNFREVDTGEKDKDNQPIIKEEFDTVDLKSFNSNDIMYVMINAIKELKAEIDILKGAK